MNVRIFNKWRVVLPQTTRRSVGIRPGGEVEVAIENGRIVLSPTDGLVFKTEIIIDAVTGLPALSAGPEAPVLTSEEVARMLIDFP